MKNTPVLRRALVAVGVVAALCLGGAAPAMAAKGSDGSLQGVKVLLTNDDSMRADNARQSDGLGLYEMRRALCAAGADVVVIAPWQVQSGRGSAVTNSGVFTLGTDEASPVPAGYEADCASAPSAGAVFGLCIQDGPCQPGSPSATPADTVKFATRGGLQATVGWEHPDLVVSGINSGLNVASSVSDSGTVGAALAAIEHGTPAVAFSASANADMSFFPTENYRATAEWGVRFMQGLNAQGLLFQSEFGLNVNYPSIVDGKAAQPATWTSVGSQTYAYHNYDAKGNGSFAIRLAVCEGVPACEEERSDADVTSAVVNNAISVTPLSWDRTFGYKMGAQQLLAKVQKFVEKDAPRP